MTGYFLIPDPEIHQLVFSLVRRQMNEPVSGRDYAKLNIAYASPQSLWRIHTRVRDLILRRANESRLQNPILRGLALRVPLTLRGAWRESRVFPFADQLDSAAFSESI